MPARSLGRAMPIIGCAICLFVATAQAGPATAPADDDVALRDYLSANGFLTRGLYELACKEYCKFLAGHAAHAKAAEAHYGLGVALFRLQRFDQAAAELEPLGNASDFAFAAEVQAILGQCRLAEKKYAAAATAFRAALSRKPNADLATAAASGLVESLYRDGRFDEAIKESARPVDGPARQRIDLYTGLSQVAQHHDAAAASTFDAVIRRGGDAAIVDRATLLLAQCHQRLDQPEKAAKLFRAILDRPDSALAAEARAGLGAALLDSGRADDAVAIFDELTAKDQTSSATDAIHLARGRALFESKDYRRALSDFEAVVDAKSDWSAAGAYWAAKCKLRLDNPAKAAESLATAIEHFPDSDLLPAMIYDRAVALARADRTDDALTALAGFQARFAKNDLAPAALKLAADLEHQQKHYEQSLRLCLKYLQQYGDRPDAASVEFLAAENSFLSGEMPAAADAFQKFITARPTDPNAPKARLRLGLALHRLNKLDDARTALAPIAGDAKTDESLRPALQVLADIASQRSEWKDAERLAEQFLAADANAPGTDQVLLLQGLARARQHRSKDAIAAFDRLLDQYASSPLRIQAQFERGQALVELGDLPAAEKSFEQVLANESDSRFGPYARNHLAAIAARNGETPRASELFKQIAESKADDAVRADAQLREAQNLAAAGLDSDAEAALRRFLQLFGNDPHAASARAQLAIAVARQKRCDEALPQIESLLKDGANALDSPLADALRYERAWCLRSMGRNDEAAAAYRSLIENGDGKLTLESRLELAEIESNAGRFGAARDQFAQLADRIAADPAVATAEIREQTAYRVAVCDFKLNHHAEAAKRFADFVANYPQSKQLASACYFAGECNFQAGRHADAIRFLSRVSQEFPDSDVCNPALLRLGDAAASLQRWPESQKAFAAWLDRFGRQEGWIAAQFGVGWALENQGKHRPAIDAYRKIAEAHNGPTAARAQFQIGECLYALKRYDEATSELLKVDILYAYPEWSAAALFEAGRCFEAMGKSAEAQAQFRTVVQKFRETRWAPLARERISAASAAVPGH